jgi:hypothetical protein
MIALDIAIICLVSILFVLVGGVIGWLYKQHSYESSYVNVHPEMFDANGNIIPDEILAVRFENDYDTTTDHEEEDNE